LPLPTQRSQITSAPNFSELTQMIKLFFGHARSQFVWKMSHRPLPPFFQQQQAGVHALVSFAPRRAAFCCKFCQPESV
jgi:hypothetical protein